LNTCHHTTDGNSWPDPKSWPAVTPTADQPGSHAEQCWVLFTYRYDTDQTAPPDQRLAWARYLCLPHVRDHLGRAIVQEQ
jgi:hypothetical protein